MCKNKQQYRPVAAIILSRNFAGSDQFLIVKKPRKNHSWQFPQGGVDNGESHLEAAIRELNEECGKDLRTKLLFNNSVGEYKYNFPPEFLRHYDDYIGAKVQFFRGILVSGEVEIDNQEIINYRWVQKKELNNYFEQSYLESVSVFI